MNAPAKSPSYFSTRSHLAKAASGVVDQSSNAFLTSAFALSDIKLGDLASASQPFEHAESSGWPQDPGSGMQRVEVATPLRSKSLDANPCPL